MGYLLSHSVKWKAEKNKTPHRNSQWEQKMGRELTFSTTASSKLSKCEGRHHPKLCAECACGNMRTESTGCQRAKTSLRDHHQSPVRRFRCNGRSLSTYLIFPSAAADDHITRRLISQKKRGTMTKKKEEKNPVTSRGLLS